MRRTGVAVLLVLSAVSGHGSARVGEREVVVAATATRAGYVPVSPRSAACTDTAYALQGWHHTSTFNWYYNPAGAPAPVASSALSVLQNGTSAVFGGRNRCGAAPRLALAHAYLGTTTRAAQVSDTGVCTGNDGISVASWGDLPESILAYTCTYYWSSGAVLSSDLLIDNRRHDFYTTRRDDCANAWDLLAVVVHERGHTAGLAHVDQDAHPTAVMSPRTVACDSSETTLSAGDVAGLRAVYGQ